MKIEFAPVSTVELKHAPLLTELGQQLIVFFQSKHYGEDLKELYIRVIAISPGLASYFKRKKPIYTFDQKNYQRNTINTTIGRALKYSITLNFESFNNANEIEAREMLKKEILDSLSLFEGFKRKIKDFNVPMFRNDMDRFFDEIAV